MKFSALALLVPGVLLAAAEPVRGPQPGELRPKPEAGQVIEKHFEQEFELTENYDRYFVNGELAGDDQTPCEMRGRVSLRVVDRYQTVEDGRLEVFLRRYAEAERVREVEYGSESDVDTETSPLVGRSVRFTRDGSDWRRRYDGEEGPRHLLDDLEVDLDLGRWLPTGEMELGDSWEVPAAATRWLLDPAGDLGFEDDDEEDMFEVLWKSMVGEVQVTWKANRDEGGRQIAVLAVSVEQEGEHQESDVDSDGDPVERSLRAALELDGEILWDLAAGRPHGYALEGHLTLGFEIEVRWVDPDDGQPMEFQQERELAGPVRLRGTWSESGR